MVSYESVARTISYTTITCITVMLLSVLTVLLLSDRILNALTHHFDWLIKKMQLLGEGLYQYPDDTHD